MQAEPGTHVLLATTGGNSSSGNTLIGAPESPTVGLRLSIEQAASASHAPRRTKARNANE